MSKFVVTVFDNEKAAYEGSKAMLQLDGEGSIALYAGAIITKGADGTVEIKDAVDEGPIGTATGMLLGTLIGALGGAGAVAAGAAAGAVGAGAAVGLAGGTLTGWYSDLYNVGVDGEFLSDVGALMLPGTSAVVAEVTEGWTTPLDSRMEKLGGVVFRRYRIDVEDNQIARDIEATNRELDELDAEWDQAVGEAKNKLQAKRDAAKAKLAALKDKVDNKVASLKEESDAKLQKLSDQIGAAKDDVKAKFETQKEQMKADYDERIGNLKEAGKNLEKALT
ncbi:hypothetical protein CA13_72930 [Planctomycetes bacterium CA13]|uniref:Uncharacterized protein n=1 Tax=Novipirellula herctigrandis TaxID=2527986 RepID=A0A5C5YPF4_9BACT|nr:hypothetical protein CA13_72930 [Planctomycetes bacterium CA13]